MSKTTMASVQQASDEAQAELSADLEPDNSTLENNDDDDSGKHIKPRNNQQTLSRLVDIHADIDAEIQKRKAANESISALREQAVTMGISKKAQAAVEAYMKLNENDQLYFDEAVMIYRKALGKPVQASLELVYSNDDLHA